jgi:hydrogenase nickel incorporation protein HypB
VFSVTEGEDKPVKYPHMFRPADLVILNNIDLQHVDFDLERAIGNLRAVKPAAIVLQVSARTGEGMADWYGWLRRQGKWRGRRHSALPRFEAGMPRSGLPPARFPPHAQR